MEPFVVVVIFFDAFLMHSSPVKKRALKIMICPPFTCLLHLEELERECDKHIIWFTVFMEQ